MSTFKINQELSSRSSCDHNCIFKAVVKKVTAKTVTILIDGTMKRCKIHNYEGKTFIYPLGNYSMCPIFRA